MQCHLDHWVFDVRGLARGGIVNEKGPSCARLLAAAVALLPLWALAVSNDIDPITIRTVK